MREMNVRGAYMILLYRKRTTLLITYNYSLHSYVKLSFAYCSLSLSNLRKMDKLVIKYNRIRYYNVNIYIYM